MQLKLSQYFRNSFLLLLAICISLTAISCNSDSAVGPKEPDLSTQLQVATPESQGFDSAKLTDALEHAKQIPGLNSLVVVRNSLIVGEEYIIGTASNINHVRSVTKSVMSTLIGIAIEKGFIESQFQPLSELLDLSFIEQLEPAKAQIQLRHLLTMTAGFEWNETGGPEFSNWISSNDRINYVLNKPLVDEPGTRFNYNSGSSHLLSVILTAATGMSTQAFADTYLFGPLGITNRGWDQDSRGYFFGGHGLILRPRDMAKLGILFLQQGSFAGQEIVPSAWITEAIKEQVTIGFEYGALKRTNYGFLWWLDSGREHSIFLAWGWGGQFIYCVPALNLVVVTSSRWNVNSTIASQQELANLDLMANYVLQAIK